MYTNILVPLDTSSAAEQILTYVQQLSVPETRLHLVAVVEPNMYSYALSAQEAAVRDKLQHVLQTDMERYLTTMTQKLRNQNLCVESWVAQGDAAQTIADVAIKIKADLIAMTTHGRTGFGRWALGSIADRVIHIAQQPILLVRTMKSPPEDIAIRRILVPSDGSQRAAEALVQAKMIAAKQGAELLIIRVVEPLTGWQQALLAEGGYSAQDIARERWQEAERYLADLCAQLQSEKLEVSGRLYSGIASDMILKVLEQDSIDLVVMSSHGLSGYNRWVYGSVAGKVLHHAPCPLLLIRGVDVQSHI
ncbi:MAG TPA: universal stress protein [Caldilineaceae bacterium]|nr:universal stress protein [Caldilineaceae bacterium]